MRSRAFDESTPPTSAVVRRCRWCSCCRRASSPLDAARVAAARAVAEGIVRGGGEAELPPRLAEDLARWEAGIAARNQAERGDGLELWSVLLSAERAYDQVGDALAEILGDEGAWLAAEAAGAAEANGEKVRAPRGNA